jgi:nitrogen fixation uncharacterized protein
MSLSEIERFAAALKSDAALRAEAERVQTDGLGATPLAGAVAFAASKGYSITIDEAKAHTRARAKAVKKDLNDAELDGTLGSAFWYWSVLMVVASGERSEYHHGRYWSLGPR